MDTNTKDVIIRSNYIVSILNEDHVHLLVIKQEHVLREIIITTRMDDGLEILGNIVKYTKLLKHESVILDYLIVECHGFSAMEEDLGGVTS